MGIEWIQKQLNWANTVRVGGLAGIGFLVVFRQHPDSTLIIALVSMMGLPSFIALDGRGAQPQPPKKDDA